MTSKKASMEKREDEATDGDGEVTMKTLEKKQNVMEQKCLHVKGHMVVRPGMACIPLVTHR